MSDFRGDNSDQTRVFGVGRRALVLLMVKIKNQCVIWYGMSWWNSISAHMCLLQKEYVNAMCFKHFYQVFKCVYWKTFNYWGQEVPSIIELLLDFEFVEHRTFSASVGLCADEMRPFCLGDGRASMKSAFLCRHTIITYRCASGNKGILVRISVLDYSYLTFYPSTVPRRLYLGWLRSPGLWSTSTYFYMKTTWCSSVE